MTETTDDHLSPLVDHLIELRNRLVYCLIAVGLAFLVLVGFANDIYEFVANPLVANMPEGSSMIATDVVTPFFTPFKLTFFVAFVAALPVVLYQVWAFLAPGLYENERGLIAPLIISSVLLFYLGMAFAYFVVFPLAFAFFISSASESVSVMTDIASYLNFVLKIFFAFGVAFEVPIAIILLLRSGLVKAVTLENKRPYIVVGCFVLGMLLTPPDVISQVLLALPMWILYECGLFIGKRVIKQTH